MKPLTIEELKSLEVGDWVWIVDLIDKKGKYFEIKSEPREIKDKGAWLFVTGRMYLYEDYGTKWLAYKNKEMAECKGEIVELPCKVGDMVYFYDFSEKEIMQGKVIGVRLNYYTPSNPIWVRVQYDIPMIKKDCDTEVWADMVFTDKSEAERRLAELKGE